MSPILLVEDNVLFRKSLGDMLRHRFPEIEIAEAGDGEEALRKLETMNAELIFMDLRLPGMSGLEATRRIKQANPGRKVVILTSYDIYEYRIAALGSGASHFFTKGNAGSEEIADFVKSFFQEKDKAKEADANSPGG